jgi:lipid-A-disaccharide synthase
MGRGRLVTILPGSRTQEVKDNLPQLLRAAQLVQRDVASVRVAVASYNESQAKLARRIVDWSGLAAEVHVGHTPELILSAQAALACSGSVSLELLYHAVPSVILYKVPWWTYAVMRRLVKVRYITLVNLLTAEQFQTDAEHTGLYQPGGPGHEHVLVPEYPTWRDRSFDLSRHVIEWLADEPKRQQVVSGLKALRARVGRSGASAKAAQYILHQLQPHEPIVMPVAPASGAAAYRKAS